MKVYVIEDDFLFREKIVEIVNEIGFSDFEIEVISRERVFFKELDVLEFTDATLFLIDIELKNYFNGIDIAEKIRQKNKNCFIAFITVFENYGMEMINRKIFPVGYISKKLPSDQLRLKIQELIQECWSVVEYRESKEMKIAVDVGGQQVILYEKNIIYIATVPGYKNMLLIKHTEGELLTPGRLKYFREQLRASYFFKELKSFIINLKKIQKLYVTEGTVQFKEQLLLDIGVSGTRKINQYLKGKVSYDY